MKLAMKAAMHHPAFGLSNKSSQNSTNGSGWHRDDGWNEASMSLTTGHPLDEHASMNDWSAAGGLSATYDGWLLSYCIDSTRSGMNGYQPGEDEDNA